MFCGWPCFLPLRTWPNRIGKGHHKMGAGHGRAQSLDLGVAEIGKLETNYWQSYTLWIRQWVSHPSILVFPSIFRYHIVLKPNYIVDFLVIISGECLDSHAIQTIRFFATPTAEKCETRMLVRWWFCYSIIIPLNPQYIPKKTISIRNSYIHIWIIWLVGTMVR